MSTEFRVACLVAALTATCGGAATEVRRVEQPTLETVAPKAKGQGMGDVATPGFLRACQTRALGAGLVELGCEQHQIVEFRKLEMEESADDESQIDQLMEILSARFGALDEDRAQAEIDATPVQLSRFKTSAPGVEGLAVIISNVEGRFWGLACYRKGGAMDEAFCGDAIATAARAGGLAHVAAKPMDEFADGKLTLGEGCEAMPGRGITCVSGKLSWSASDSDAAPLREETMANLAAMANDEEVAFSTERVACTLLGKSADCHWLQIKQKKKSEELNFVLAIGGGQERLVVCTFPGPWTKPSPLPEPCAQALVLLDR